MITFQRDPSQALRKTFLGCKWDKGEDLDLKEVEKEFTMTRFFRVNALREGNWGLHAGRNLLKFSLAREHEGHPSGPCAGD